MKYDGALFDYAAQRADEDGLCFVHVADDGPPTHVVMTAERYREITGRIFAGAIPLGDPEWMHDHATPEMLAHALGEEEGEYVGDHTEDISYKFRREPIPMKLEDGTVIRVRHERISGPSEKPGKVVLFAKGGRTVVEILGEDGTPVVSGVAVCSPLDNYNRRLGRTIALGRAQKELRALASA